MLSDRIGRKPLLVAGWVLYAAVYFALGRADAAWHAWALFAVYGLYFGLTEGVEKALVADLVPVDRRGLGVRLVQPGPGRWGTAGVAALRDDLGPRGGADGFRLRRGYGAAAAVGIAVVAPGGLGPAGGCLG